MGTQESIVIDNNQINEHFKQYQYEKDNFNIDCNVHQNKGMNEYVYSLDVNLSETIPPEFIIIIDRSSSMGSTFNYIITKTIPEVLKALGYNNRKIHLITFESYVNYFSLSQSELSQSKLNEAGSTYMAQSFLALEKIFSFAKDKCKHFRILTISDGVLNDQGITKQKGEMLYQKYKDSFKINSQCVRLKNNSSNVETVGLMSILKFNNVKHCYLVEHNSKDISDLAKVIIPLFLNDGLSGSNLQIKGDDVNLRNNPWEKNNSNTQVLENGKITIFADKNVPLYVEDQTKIPFYINCKEGEEINSDNYEEIIGTEKLSHIFQKVRMNKILNTNESKKENKDITDYFKNLSQLTTKVDESENNLEYLNEQIESINNDNRINNLNDDQKANYVQNLDEITRTLEINKLKKDNKKLKNQMNSLMQSNINLNNELYEIKIKLKNLEKIIEFNNNYNEKNIDQNETENNSIKNDNEEKIKEIEREKIERKNEEEREKKIKEIEKIEREEEEEREYNKKE